ncbi:hypothetical protein D2Q93_13840 [Alicyclobacillaceae bacterium I2511]|jgi:hypothetical protein|nr:hypothetical protein D2Q93_13840 [Alicyclobacillaceae bacterium I2511]
MRIRSTPQPLHIGDSVTVYTTGSGPGNQGLTGIILRKSDKSLSIGLFPIGTPPIQSGQIIHGPIVAIATIFISHITTVIQRIS